MPKILPHLLYTFLLSVVCITRLSSQTVSALPNEGCAPLVGVQFTGLSGASNVQWAFGDGTFSNLNNPTHTYATAGNFSATYSATVGGSPVSQSVVIKVYGKPTPNFTVNVNGGCVPLNVSFTDQSVNSGGSLPPQWQWSFGDGGVSNVQHPNYVYTIPGTFNVTLIYKDGHGCDSSITKTALIKTSIKPNVVITASPGLNACTAPYTATFSGSSSSSNSTTGSTALTYNWNLNGASSSSPNPPAVTFTATGSYPVSLTCTDNNGCSDTKTVTVNVLAPQVKALLKPVACFNTPFSVRDSSASSFTQWNFGDGSPVQNVFPPNILSHVYSNGGTYTITATTFLGSCTAIKTFTVTVEKPVPAFTSAPSFSCSSPLVVTYNNTSTGAATYSWTFSGGGTNGSSTLANPSFTFTQGSLNPYTIFLPQPLTAKLVVISPGGCRDSLIRSVDTLHRPTAFFHTDIIQGCNPLTVTFRDTSQSSHPIINYTWNFGDGSPLNAGSTNTLVTHTYTTPGTYYATLFIQNSLGCKDTSFKWPIYVASPPHPSFSFSPSVVCPYEPVTITNLTPLADSVNHWHLTSDASYYSHCISDRNPSWAYSHTGSHPLTLTAYSHGCMSDTTLPTGVLVKGPIVSGRFYTRCDSVFKVKFNLFLQDAAFAEIRYGDGARDTVLGNNLHSLTHTYAATGNYTVVLKGENPSTGCLPYYDTLIVKVRDIKSVITTQSVSCLNASANFSASSSQDVDAVCGVGYIWFFGNNPPVITDNAALSYSLLPSGNQTVKLVVKDLNGCRDTSSSTIFVSSITAGAALSNTIGCVPAFSLSATQSVSSNTTVTAYTWNFGDGSPSVTGPSVTHTYTNAVSPASTYTVQLNVTNAHGCSDVKMFPVVMNAPFPPGISGTSSQLCVGRSVNLSTSAGSVNTYTWNYGDSSPVTTGSVVNTSHTYTAAGTYTVTLQMADPNGCKANASTYIVQVQSYPTALLSYTNQNNPGKQNACAGSTVLFSDNSVNPYTPQTRHWDFGNGGGPVVGNPVVGTTYTSAGNYTVSLVNCTPFGCCDTTRTNIRVYSADADFSLSKTTVCKNESVTFTIKDTANVYVWGWDFGDGTDYNLTPQSPMSHTYNYHPPGGTTNVSLTYYSADSACRYSVIKPLTIYQLIADFDRNNELLVSDTAHCLGSADIFNNHSQNADSYLWNFGDGSSSASQSPSHTYGAAGTYTVALFIKNNQHGCKDTLKKTMIIYPVPILKLAGRDTCQARPTQLTVSGGSTYTWTPATGLSDPHAANPIATLNNTTVFTVTANNTFGCAGTNTLQINIQEPPASISWDTTIVIGEWAMLPGYAGPGFSYTWTPSDYLSCTSCINPVATPTVDFVYTVKITDRKGCFERVNTYTVHIEEKSSVDVPTAFTPNGDGINDRIMLDGWGIKKLNYFRVYNRWGELIYETNDLNAGWDGYYKGVPQNMETYIYHAEVETYTDSEPIQKTGYFKLLR